jgi:hypothetical protein
MRGYASKVRYARIHKENVVCKDTRLLLIGTAGRKVDRHAAIRAADSLHRDADRPGKLLPLYLLGIVGVLLDAHSPCNTALRQSFVFLYQQLRQYLYFCARQPGHGARTGVGGGMSVCTALCTLSCVASPASVFVLLYQ